MGSIGKLRSLVTHTVYHGTNVSNIETFNLNGRESNGAIFFADDVDYAEEEANVKFDARGGTKTIYEVTLDIKNPMYVTLSGKEFADNAIEKAYIQKAKAEGYDAVIFKTGDDVDPLFAQTFYAVFSPKQVTIHSKREL